MAKKVKIIIKDEELVPTVIGEIDKKKAGIISLLIVFIILTVFIIFMPEIDEFVDNLQTQEEKIVEQPQEEDVLYFQNSMSIYNDLVTLSNVQLNGYTLSFNITNTTNSMINLENEHLYLDIYDADDNLIGRINFSDINLYSGEVYQYEAELLYNDIYYFEFGTITESQYPEVTLSLDENGEQTLVCIKDDLVLTYRFDNNLLTSIINKQYISEEEISDYAELANTYNSYLGINATIEEGLENYFVYTLDLELYSEELDETENMYNYKTDAKIINFEMTSEGFDCN